MPSNNKTLEEHFIIFQEEAEEWIDWFELRCWLVSYAHDNSVDNLAECWVKTVGKTAKLVLGINWEEEEVTINKIRRCAFHEVCEIWLADLSCLAEARYTTANEIEKETHRLIRLLENKLWK